MRSCNRTILREVRALECGFRRHSREKFLACEFTRATLYQGYCGVSCGCTGCLKTGSCRVTGLRQHNESLKHVQSAQCIVQVDARRGSITCEGGVDLSTRTLGASLRTAIWKFRDMKIKGLASQSARDVVESSSANARSRESLKDDCLLTGYRLTTEEKSNDTSDVGTIVSRHVDKRQLHFRTDLVLAELGSAIFFNISRFHVIVCRMLRVLMLRLTYSLPTETVLHVLRQTLCVYRIVILSFSPSCPRRASSALYLASRCDTLSQAEIHKDSRRYRVSYHASASVGR